jgi:tRNA threonylcarbamoyladenosine biosynthesis protein TsaE
MLSVTWQLPDLEATATAGRRLGSQLFSGAVLLFFGAMGSGKTTLIKQICAGLGVDPNIVISPTYTLVNMYPASVGMIHHLDLYRIQTAGELDDFDRDDLISADGVTLVEWPDLLLPLLDQEPTLRLQLQATGECTRELRLESDSPLFQELAA